MDLEEDGVGDGLWDFGNASPVPNAGAWLLAAGVPLASPSFSLSPADVREGTGCGRGTWGVLVRPPAGEFAPVSAGGGLTRR